MSTIALGSQWFSGSGSRPADQRTSLRALTCNFPYSQGWRVVWSPEATNTLRLEAATVSYFLSLTDDELLSENQLGNAVGDSAGLIDFNE